MTKEKELLLKYLCMALPYDVVVRCYFVDGGGEEVLDTDDIADLLYNEGNSEFPIYKPYLRSMSSMTEEEHKEYEQWLPDGFNINTVNWLLEHHFDFIGLIPKDLAIEVTEKNNTYEN